MLMTFETEIDENGMIPIGKLIKLPKGKRVLVTILDEDNSSMETALLSEAALHDWNRPEEDDAWANLQ